MLPVYSFLLNLGYSSGMDMYRFRGIFKLNVEKTHEKRKRFGEVGDRIETERYFT